MAITITKERPVLRQLMESHTKDAGGDVYEGGRRVADLIGGLLDSSRGTEKPKLDYRKIDLQEAFNLMVPIDAKHADVRAVAEATYKSGFDYLFDRQVSEVLIQGYQYNLGNAFDLVHEVKSTHETEDIPGVTATEGLAMVPGGEPVPLTTFGEKRAQIKNYTFARAIQLHHKMILYDNINFAVANAEAIAIKSGNDMHKYIVQKLTSQAVTLTGEAANTSLKYNGTTRTMYSNDSSAFYGYTNKNLITDALDRSAVDAAWRYLYSMQDERGDYIDPGAPLFLIVHPALMKEAERYFTGPMAGDTANNAPNVYLNSFKIFPSPYVNSASYWYLGAPQRQTRFQWVQKMTTERLGNNTQLAFTNGIVKQVKICGEFGCGCIDSRFVICSTGAA